MFVYFLEEKQELGNDNLIVSKFLYNLIHKLKNQKARALGTKITSSWLRKNN
jgi:hypothetical protein